MKHSKYYELNSEETTKAYLRDYFKRLIKFLIALLFIGAGEVIIARTRYVIVVMPVLLIVLIIVFFWGIMSRAFNSLELNKVLTTDCDPGKFINVMDRLSKHWNFKYSLKNVPTLVMAAYIFERDYDIAEMRANEALGRSKNQKYRLYITSYLGRIYYSTDRYDKFLENYEQMKETYTTIKLNNAARAVFDDDFLRQDALIAYKEGRLEDAKKIMESLKDRRFSYRINDVADACFLGDINFELGNYVEAAAKYLFVTENGNKLKMVSEAQEKIDEIKEKVGENQ